MLSPRRLHIASTVLILRAPFFICRHLLLNTQVPFSTRQQAIHGTVLFTPDLLTPHTAFSSLSATVLVFWNVSTHFSYPCTPGRCHVHAMPHQSTKIGHLPRDASAILRERYLAGTFSVTTQWQRASNAEYVSIWWRHHDKGVHLTPVFRVLVQAIPGLLTDATWRHLTPLLESVLALRQFDPGQYTETERSSFDDNFVTGCTGNFHFDNLRCSQWRKYRQYDNLFRFSVHIRLFSTETLWMLILNCVWK